MVIALAWMLSLHPGWVRVWTDRDEPYGPGGRARVFFQLDQPGYVTALRIDTDGRVRVLFPRTPWADNYIDAQRTFALTGPSDDYAFPIDDAEGVGYVFVLASPEPFDYTDLVRDDYWDYRLFAGGRLRGDPYVALTDLAERLSPRGAYDYDLAPYYVGHHYDFPRFVCTQCHSQPHDRTWDAYRRQCSRFRLVIYDDPAYYAYRYNRGRHVVVDRPLHPGPRFVFRDPSPGAAYVTRLQGRAEEADQRRTRDLSPVRPLVERHREEEPRRRVVPRRAYPRDDRPRDDRSRNDRPSTSPEPRGREREPVHERRREREPVHERRRDRERQPERRDAGSPSAPDPELRRRGP